MLEELAKEDSKWRQYAYGLCKDHQLSGDLVNDMYLRLYNTKSNSFSKRYIFRTLRNLFLDHIKTNNKTVSLEDIAIIESDNNEVTSDRLDLLDMLDDTLGLFKKEVLLITHEMSLRKAEAETGVSHLKLHYHKQKGLDKLRQKYNGRAKG